MESAKSLFFDDVVSFGTRAAHVSGVEQLCETQWRPVWTRTRDFGFEVDDMTLWTDGAMAAVAVNWSSSARDATATRRQGRATIILERTRDGEVRARHTHFSLRPVPEECLD